MFESPVPLLSTYNGPSYLLHAVETLYRLGVPESNVRLTPVIGWCLGPEVEPYYQQSNLGQATRVDPATLFVRLNVNIRQDRRLRRFLPLTAVGIALQREVVAWRARGVTAGVGYRQLYERLGEIDPDWTNNESPTERLTRQLCTHFPELRDTGTAIEPSSDRILVVRPPGRWEERPNPYVNAGRRREIESDAPYESAQALVELFLTRALTLVATADMVGGFEYRLRIEPEGRAIDVVITRDSDLHEVVRWLLAYPHRPLPEVRYPEMDDRERAQWDEYFARHPDHDNIFETAAMHWTVGDPAIVALHGDIRREYEGGRNEAITPDEMLAFARKHLPDYVPYYPHQFAVTGGMNLEGILIGLMETWLGQGPFLGVIGEEWDLFTPEDRVVLCGLLIQRRQILDQSALFQAAVRLLVDPGIETAVEAYRLEPIRLGKPLAQPNRTLSLDGVAALHAPEMVVKIPLDRDRDERSPAIERKLNVIARLFLPFHIAMKTIWQIDRPTLGRATYLRRKNDPVREAGPACRLS